VIKPICQFFKRKFPSTIAGKLPAKSLKLNQTSFERTCTPITPLSRSRTTPRKIKMYATHPYNPYTKIVINPTQ